MPALDIAGVRFGDLVVVSKAAPVDGQTAREAGAAIDAAMEAK